MPSTGDRPGRRRLALRRRLLGAWLLDPAVNGKVAKLLGIFRHGWTRWRPLGQFPAVRLCAVVTDLELRIGVTGRVVADDANGDDEVLPVQLRPEADSRVADLDRLWLRGEDPVVALEPLGPLKVFLQSQEVEVGKVELRPVELGDLLGVNRTVVQPRHRPASRTDPIADLVMGVDHPDPEVAQVPAVEGYQPESVGSVV